jgi:hypothetical protein
MVNKHIHYPEQTKLENKACFLLESAPVNKTVEEIFGPMEEWIFKLNEKWQLLLMPATKRWWYYDWLHDDWQDTGFDLGSAVFYLENGLLEVEPLSQSGATEKVAQSPPLGPVVNSAFSGAASRFAILKANLDRGAISSNYFMQALNDLRFQDEQGNWWQISEDGMGWLRWDGKAWIVANPVDKGIK